MTLGARTSDRASRIARRAGAALLAFVAAVLAGVVVPAAAQGEPGLAVRELRDAVRTDVPGPDLTGYLGVVTEAGGGAVRVSRIVPGSPADDAGLRAGDVLRGLGGTSLRSGEDLTRALEGRRPGDVVAVAAERDGRALATSARLSAKRVRDGLFRGNVFRLAVVPIRFADDDGPPATADDLRALLFARTGTAGAGASLADYYAAQSYGRLSVEGDVLDTLTLPSPRARYAALPMGAAKGSAWQDAADLLRNRRGDAALVAYDGIAFLYGGPPETRAGHALWPHRATVSLGGRRVPYYVHGLGESDGLAIGVHCHEFGHLLGLPDTYGAAHRTGSGDFCLMAIGHRGGGPSGSASPFSICAPCRIRLGWIDAVAVDPRTPQRLRLRSVASAPTHALLVPLDPRCEEYLVLENRTRTGFDAEIPSDGLLVWHAGGRPTPGQGVYAQPVDLVEAHGIDVFDASLVRIDEIAFPTARARDLTADTRPAIRPSRPISFPCSVTSIVREDGGAVVLTLGVPARVRQAAPAPYAFDAPDAEGYVVRRDPVTGEDARFYVGPRERAPRPVPAPAAGPQERR